MSSKEITITTAEGNTLDLIAVRKIECRVKRQGLLITERHFTKKVYVQYGVGVGGEGATLKDALADFRRNWTFFCDNREAIMRGEVKGWN